MHIPLETEIRGDLDGLEGGAGDGAGGVVEVFARGNVDGVLDHGEGEFGVGLDGFQGRPEIPDEFAVRFDLDVHGHHVVAEFGGDGRVQFAYSGFDFDGAFSHVIGAVSCSDNKSCIVSERKSASEPVLSPIRFSMHTVNL